jgi:cytidine deaminase
MKGEEPYILSPCGRCREFICQIDENNINTEVVLDVDLSQKLSTLLPVRGWFNKMQE